MIIIIASIVVAGVVILGALLAAAFRGFNRAVVNEQDAAEVEMRSYNPGLTYGYKIPVTADAQAQMRAARLEAARQAASLPRGANSVIGQSKGGEVRTAYQGIGNDPISAVKMATIHSWEGLRSGSKFTPAQTVTHASAQTAPPTKTADDLVPGKDYEVIEITEEMSPAEKRKARIANAKAKSAAAKALKASAPSAAAAPTQRTTLAAADSAAPTPSSIAEPVAGIDYEVIEISDDMSPDEVRKARIANVKAKSAAMKAYKASAGAAAAASEQAPAPQAAGMLQKPPSAEPDAAPSGAASIAPPELIEIVEGMAPDEVRKARIHNAKAQAAYKKALKAAGIDPNSV